MHPLQRDINDMGEFRSEHRGNFAYFMVTTVNFGIAVFFCVPLLIMIAVGCIIHSFDAKVKPEEAFAYLLLAVFISYYLVRFVNEVRQKRKNPLLYALYEKGLLVVYRNQTIRRVFWDNIDEIQWQKEKRYYYGLGKPVFQGITLLLHPDELGIVTQPINIQAEFFQNAKQLCHAICEAKGQNDQM